ncbi:hypothetical protein Tco_1341539 [Tanacetum coccineum]
MGPSKELNVRSPSTSTNLHEEGASSNEQKNQTSICDIRMYIQDATEYSSITGNNHISPCTLPHIQNTECANLFTKTTNISTENENTNFTTTHLQVNNQNKISPDDLKKAMSRTQVTKAVVGNSDRSNVQVTIDKHNKPSTVTINDNMQTSPLASILSLPIASSKVILSRSEYCSIDATICRYLSGTTFNSLRTSVSSSIVCPRLAALFTKVVSFVVKVSMVSSSFMCSNSNSDLSVCNLACWTLSSPMCLVFKVSHMAFAVSTLALCLKGYQS